MIDVVVPKWGMTMEEGVIVSWLKEVGDSVEEDEPIAELATDKIEGEIFSPASGTLVDILHQAGSEVAVGEPIAQIDPS